MARTRAAEQTAYDLGFRAGRDDEAGPAPDYIANDPELLDAYDAGLSDGQAAGDDPAAPLPARRTRTPHRAAAKPAKASPRAPAKPKPKKSALAQEADNFDASTTPTRTIDDTPAFVKHVATHQAHTASSFLLGTVAYAIGINFLRGGPTQVAAWFNAKFFNKVNGQSPDVDNTQAVAPATTTPTPTPSGGGGTTAAPKPPKHVTAKSGPAPKVPTPIVAPPTGRTVST